MAFAMPLAARSRTPRARALTFRLVPGVLLAAGALLLSQPWRTVAAPAFEPASLLGALLVIGGLLFFLPALLKRLAPATRAGGRIEVVEARPLGGRKSLLLVKVADRRLLIGASENGLVTLAELPEEPRGFGRALDQELATASGVAAAPQARGE